MVPDRQFQLGRQKPEAQFRVRPGMLRSGAGARAGPRHRRQDRARRAAEPRAAGAGALVETVAQRRGAAGDALPLRPVPMAVHSAGILLYRREPLQVFLIHPGGPFWARKDLGAWSIPKGLVGESEEPLAAARREFFEETGFRAEGEAEALGTFRQPSGKRLTV